MSGIDDPTNTPDMRVRYDVLLGENRRLRAQIEQLVKDLAGLRPPAPPIVPRTFGDDAQAAVQHRYNLGQSEALNREAFEDMQREISDLKTTVIAFAGPWAAQWAKDRGLPDGHMHPTHYDLLARCGARMASFTRAEKELP